MHLLIGIASTLEAIAKCHSNEYKEANQDQGIEGMRLRSNILGFQEPRM